MKSRTGIAGGIAGAFLKSKLTLLIVAASLLLGLFALMVTPREEEPQIVVPMIDVFAAYPGASAREVEEVVTRPMENLLKEIPGVEYVYSTTSPGGSLAIVRFYVGQDMEKSIVNTYNKLLSNADLIPPGVSPPLVKPRSIDDVPILVFNLWSERYSSYDLRRFAVELADQLAKDRDVSKVRVIGGRRREVRVDLQPDKLRAYNLSVASITAALQGSNLVTPAGGFSENNQRFEVQAGGFLENAADVGNVVVGVNRGRPVFLGSVARVTDGPGEPNDYVFMGTGPAFAQKETIGGGRTRAGAGLYDAVSISVAKKKGTNATLTAGRLTARIEDLRGRLLPADVQVNVARNYGATAKEKSDELLKHMLIAVISVIILVALTLGWRESLVVAVAVPVTLALTLLVTYLYGYTLNRVTLFALIFSIGILVDDAIVVIENIHRHFKLHGPGEAEVIRAVDEVGNPTILATLTVIAALLPMAFVSGLMGPYMRPIPIGASAAMIFSLMVAFVVSPWMGYKVLGRVKRRPAGEKREDEKLSRIYHRILTPLLNDRKKRLLTLTGVAGLLCLALLMVPFKLVRLKMLPFDNKNEMQVIIDMPLGTTLEETGRVATALGDYLRSVPEVTDFQLYVGTASPYNFNGLVRHYYLRSGPNVADIQVNLVGKGLRRAQSHDIAKRIRPGLDAIARRYGANVKVAEIPPGPPVLDTLVAEVYGPSLDGQLAAAARVKQIFNQTPGVVDVDWYVDAPQKKYTLEVDKTKAALSGVSTLAASDTLATALNGKTAGLVHIGNEREPVPLVLRAPEEDRSGLTGLLGLGVPSDSGRLVPLGEITSLREGAIDQTIYHKNLQRAVYVIGDVAGREESPVYAILKMVRPVGRIVAGGKGLKEYFTAQPPQEEDYSVKWDGEWQITYQVFRDMGIAFAAVLILIYILVVAWFGDFAVPLVIMAPIPLTLIGIFPGHLAFGAFFTATSMIGFISLSGIIVRNSVLLVDFMHAHWAECGDLKEALIRAGTVRFRPIVLTAAAVVVGSSVILFDPIFQGLAIALMFGAIAATALTLVVVPLLYYQMFKNRPCPRRIAEGEDRGRNAG